MPLAEGTGGGPGLRQWQATPSPLLTVVMATLNAAPHLSESLGSLAAQDSRDFEVVLVDGGSRDATLPRAASLLTAARDRKSTRLNSSHSSVSRMPSSA